MAMQNGTCMFGLQNGTGTVDPMSLELVYVLGIPSTRYTFVVFDREQNLIGMTQAKWHGTEMEVVDLGKGGLEGFSA